MRSTSQLQGLLKPRKRIKARNVKRRASRFEHDYHSKERVEFIAEMACLPCSFLGEQQTTRSENAHSVVAGKGLKARYDTIFPACRKHHRAYDQHRAPFDDPDARLTMKIAAKLVQDMWLRYHGEDNAETPKGILA